MEAIPALAAWPSLLDLKPPNPMSIDKKQIAQDQSPMSWLDLESFAGQSAPEAGSEPRRCSLCGLPIKNDLSTFLPFCSQRCQELDLGKWLDERYGLPFENEDSPHGEADESE